MLFIKQPLERVTRWTRWSLRLQNGLYHPQRKKHSWWLSKFYMVRNTDCYLHRQIRHKVLKLPFSPLHITVRILMDLSDSLGTLRSQKITKLDSFRGRDRMVKQITPPRDIPFLKSGLSLVGEEHGKVGSASNL